MQKKNVRVVIVRSPAKPRDLHKQYMACFPSITDGHAPRMRAFYLDFSWGSIVLKEEWITDKAFHAADRLPVSEHRNDITIQTLKKILAKWFCDFNLCYRKM